MIAMKVMTEEGKKQFIDFINLVKLNATHPRPDLNIPPYSEEFRPQVMVDETKTFQSKLELAEYLDTIFTQWSVGREAVLGKNGLWTWLAYLWFDRLAPVDNTTGNRLIGEMAKYICSSDYRDYYRHLIAGSYMIYSRHRDHSRIFLYSPIHKHNDFIEQIASRQFIIAHPNLIEAFTRLYFDNGTGRPKSGAQSRTRAGNIRRFVKIIQQFEVTYDLYDMEPQQIINLLPSEFEEWRP